MTERKNKQIQYQVLSPRPTWFGMNYSFKVLDSILADQDRFYGKYLWYLDKMPTDEEMKSLELKIVIPETNHKTPFVEDLVNPLLLSKETLNHLRKEHGIILQRGIFIEPIKILAKVVIEGVMKIENTVWLSELEVVEEEGLACDYNYGRIHATVKVQGDFENYLFSNIKSGLRGEKVIGRLALELDDLARNMGFVLD